MKCRPISVNSYPCLICYVWCHSPFGSFHYSLISIAWKTNTWDCFRYTSECIVANFHVRSFGTPASTYLQPFRFNMTPIPHNGKSLIRIQIIYIQSMQPHPLTHNFNFLLPLLYFLFIVFLFSLHLIHHKNSFILKESIN